MRPNEKAWGALKRLITPAAKGKVCEERSGPACVEEPEARRWQTRRLLFPNEAVTDTRVASENGKCCEARASPPRLQNRQTSSRSCCSCLFFFFIASRTCDKIVNWTCPHQNVMQVGLGYFLKTEPNIFFFLWRIWSWKWVTYQALGVMCLVNKVCKCKTKQQKKKKRQKSTRKIVFKKNLKKNKTQEHDGHCTKYCTIVLSAGQKKERKNERMNERKKERKAAESLVPTHALMHSNAPSL